MKNYLKKLAVFTSIGLALLSIIALVYIKVDPFMVIHEYENYYGENQRRFANQANVTMNRDFVNTNTYINNTKNKQIVYNSFIFGNSRSMYINVADWLKYLPENATPFHYNSFAESLWAILKKVEYLDKNNIALDNVLLVLDNSILREIKPRYTFLNTLHPKLDEKESVIKFHSIYFKAFLKPTFMYSYFDLYLTKKYKSYMRNELDITKISYNAITNEYRMSEKDSLIAIGKYHTPAIIKKHFYHRDSMEVVAPIIIGGVQSEMLQKISAVFKKQNTSYKVVIQPLYDQRKMNPADIQTLQGIFSKDNVFDFSGINDMTADYHNFYENSHYIPKVAKQFIDSIYL